MDFISKIKWLFFLILIVNNLYSQKINIYCYNAKAELIELDTGKTNGFSKDSMKLNLIIRNNTAYTQSRFGKAKLLYIGGYNPQFIETTTIGNKILYTFLVKEKILTIQKTYELFNHPIMVNVYMQCKIKKTQ